MSYIPADKNWRAMPAADRFWYGVHKGESCWEWIGRINGSGYGRFEINGECVLTHRFSYELNVGPIPAGMFVCHHCDNRPCVRPDHLFLGDAKANTTDAFQKGRRRLIYPPRAGVLSMEKAIAIRAAWANGAKIDHLAKQYRVARTSILAIVRGRSYRMSLGPLKMATVQR